MALPASATAPAPHGNMLLRSLSCQLRIPVVWRVLYRPFSAASSSWGSPRMELLNNPHNDPPKIKINLYCAAKKLHEVIPDSFQKFPWSEAEVVATKQVLSLLQEAWKWSLTALFVLGFLSDIAYTISRNKELFIPFGLRCGCVAEFLKEAYQELLQHSQLLYIFNTFCLFINPFHGYVLSISSTVWQERSKTWHFLGVASHFVLIRIIAISSPATQAFLFHAANGGAMHVLSQWRSFINNERDSITDIISEVRWEIVLPLFSV